MGARPAFVSAAAFSRGAIARGTARRPLCKRPARPVSVRRGRVRMTATLPTRDEVSGASFMQCVQHGQKLFGEYDTSLTDERIALLQAMLQTSNGARGYFVSLLSMPQVVHADQDTLAKPLVEMLQGGSSSPLVADLIVKNVVMSRAMEVFYTYNKKEDLIKGSFSTVQRAVRVARSTIGAPNSQVPAAALAMLHALDPVKYARPTAAQLAPPSGSRAAAGKSGTFGKSSAIQPVGKEDEVKKTLAAEAMAKANIPKWTSAWTARPVLGANANAPKEGADLKPTYGTNAATPPKYGAPVVTPPKPADKDAAIPKIPPASSPLFSGLAPKVPGAKATTPTKPSRVTLPGRKSPAPSTDSKKLVGRPSGVVSAARKVAAPKAVISKPLVRKTPTPWTPPPAPNAGAIAGLPYGPPGAKPATGRASSPVARPENARALSSGLPYAPPGVGSPAFRQPGAITPNTGLPYAPPKSAAPSSQSAPSVGSSKDVSSLTSGLPYAPPAPTSKSGPVSSAPAPSSGLPYAPPKTSASTRQQPSPVSSPKKATAVSSGLPYGPPGSTPSGGQSSAAPASSSGLPYAPPKTSGASALSSKPSSPAGGEKKLSALSSGLPYAPPAPSSSADPVPASSSSSGLPYSPPTGLPYSPPKTPSPTRQSPSAAGGQKSAAAFASGLPYAPPGAKASASSSPASPASSSNLPYSPPGAPAAGPGSAPADVSKGGNLSSGLPYAPPGSPRAGVSSPAAAQSSGLPYSPPGSPRAGLSSSSVGGATGASSGLPYGPPGSKASSASGGSGSVADPKSGLPYGPAGAKPSSARASPKPATTGSTPKKASPDTTKAVVGRPSMFVEETKTTGSKPSTGKTPVTAGVAKSGSAKQSGFSVKKPTGVKPVEKKAPAAEEKKGVFAFFANIANLFGFGKKQEDPPKSSPAKSTKDSASSSKTSAPAKSGEIKFSGLPIKTPMGVSAWKTADAKKTAPPAKKPATPATSKAPEQSVPAVKKPATRATPKAVPEVKKSMTVPSPKTEEVKKSVPAKKPVVAPKSAAAVEPKKTAPVVKKAVGTTNARPIDVLAVKKSAAAKAVGSEEPKKSVAAVKKSEAVGSTSVEKTKGSVAVEEKPVSVTEKSAFATKSAEKKTAVKKTPTIIEHDGQVEIADQDYIAFVKKWGYDEQQRKWAAVALAYAVGLEEP